MNANCLNARKLEEDLVAALDGRPGWRTVTRVLRRLRVLAWLDAPRSPLPMDSARVPTPSLVAFIRSELAKLKTETHGFAGPEHEFLRVTLERLEAGEYTLQPHRHQEWPGDLAAYDGGDPFDQDTGWPGHAVALGAILVPFAGAVLLVLDLARRFKRRV